MVRLPFKRGPPLEIGESHSIAEKFLKNLHRRFYAKSQLKSDYTEFLNDYERLGHMRKVDKTALSSQCVYLPHHPVIRESSLTTQLRVVFNTSSRTSNATSLNDHLLTGPKLQTDLTAVILRWCQFRYIYSADIAKMYQQILVDPRDLNYQRILWSERDTEQAQAYQLLTVTYGTASAPFLALRVLKQLVKDEGGAFPLAMSVLEDHIYVDDVLFGADDVPLLRQIRNQVCALLQQGQFNLRKWSSNTLKLLSDIDNENHGLACSKALQTDEQVKILGISWSPSLDVFQFRVEFPTQTPNTKRSILSIVAKMFDPLGWSTPVTIVAKIFLQQLWQIKLDWDDPLPSAFVDKWKDIQSSLTKLNNVQLDRWIQRGADTVNCELHGFSDASTSTYAAAIYIRVISLAGQVTSMLLISKSKVAPVKTLSVPRLELAAAVLLARLMEFVRTSLHMTTVPCTCWTDSTVILAWVSQHATKWKTFVANRVSEIQSRIPFASWRHVSTVDNPADCASRGIPGESFAAYKIWWQGPSWLLLPASEWSSQPDTSKVDTNSEQNPRVISHIVNPVEQWDLATRYSSWPKLIRVTAYVMRYISRLRRRVKRCETPVEVNFVLSSEDYKTARDFWVKRIQAEVFPLERDALIQKNRFHPRAFYCL